MLSLWSKKTQNDFSDNRQLHRESRKNSDAVVYAAKNKGRGTAFAYSGPAGSRYADQALAIAGRVYSNENTNDEVLVEEDGRSKSPTQNRHKQDTANGGKPQSELSTHQPVFRRKPNHREKHAADNTASRQQRKLSAEDVESVFSATSKGVPRASISSRRSEVSDISVSDVSSIAGTQVSTNRHGVPIGGTGFKHENQNQVSYGLQDDGRKLFVSAPKDSREGDTLTQVAEMAARSGQATITERSRHSIRGLLS